MTPDRLAECLDALDWSLRGLAAQVSVQRTQVHRWATGAAPIPPPVADWLERLARFHQQNPAPPKPARRTIEDFAATYEDPYT